MMRRWQRYLTVEEAQRYMAFRIFVKVNGLRWSLAREHAKNLPLADIHAVIAAQTGETNA